MMSVSTANFYRFSLFVSLHILLCLSTVIAGTGEILEFYDVAKDGNDFVVAPSNNVTILVEPTKSLVSISPYFYGVNIHPVPASWAFRNYSLVKDLHPDVIRIMGLRRIYWLRDSDDKSFTLRSELSPAKGVYDFTELDAMIEKIQSIGAKTYLTLGFGAPSWLADPEGSKHLPRVKAEQLGEYAQLMGRVVKHVKCRFKDNVKWVTIENEPENLKYSIEDFSTLVQLAAIEIKKVAPEILIGGPVTGYATWKQPNGEKVSFANGLKRLKKKHLPFDLIDWHIYSTNPELIFKTVDIVSEVWQGKAKVISELNLDWQYSGKGGKISKKRNTGWRSVAWLAYCYDRLQLMGVGQVHYFCLGNDNFGLYDYHQTKVSPNYYLFKLMTNVMGRKRIRASSSNSAVGVIATIENGEIALLIYNRSDSSVTVKFDMDATRPVKVWDYNKAWYEANKLIVNGNVNQIVPSYIDADNSLFNISARGLILLKYKYKQ